MGSYEHLQDQFTGGEISPRLTGRVSDDLYKKALAGCLNWEPTPQGSLRTRGGTQLVASLQGDDAQSRIVPFKVAGAQDFILELSSGNLKVFADDSRSPLGIGSQQQVTQKELVANGNFAGGLAGWGTSGQVAYNPLGQATPENNAAGNGTCAILTTNSYGAPVATLQQTLTLTAAAHLFLTFNFMGTWGGSGSHTSLGGIYADVSRACTVMLGTAPGLSNVMRWAPGDGDLKGRWSTNPVVLTSFFAAPLTGVPAGNYYLTIQLNPIPLSLQGNVFRVYFTNISCTANVANAGTGLAFALNTPWQAADLPKVQYAQDTGNNRMVFVHPKYPPQLLTYGGTPNAWTMAPCVFANPPSMWATKVGNGTGGDPGNWAALLKPGASAVNPLLAAPWSGTNWPGAVAIWQGRLWLAAQNNLWASRAGDLFDFTPMDVVSNTATITPSTAFVLTLLTDGYIQWLKGKRVMLVGTDQGEYSVQAAPVGSAGSVWAADSQAWQESGYGSFSWQAVDIGEQLLFVSADLRKIRAMNYVHDEHAFLARDVTFVAEHLTKPLVKELHYARDPHATIVAVLQDGTLALCTFDRSLPMAAWYRFTTSGQVLSAAVANGTQGSVVYLVVSRANGLFLEKLPMSEAYRGWNSTADAAVTTNVPADLVVTGLGHLVGQTVNILLFDADGSIPPALEPQQVVAADPGGAGGLVPAAAPWASQDYGVGALVSAQGPDGLAHTYQALQPMQASQGEGQVGALGMGMFVPQGGYGGPPGPQWLDLGVTGSSVGGGMVTLARAGAKVTIGLPIPTPTVTTLPPEGGNPRGTSQRAKRRWVKCGMRLNDSALPIVNGKPAASDRSPGTKMDTAEPSTTGDVVAQVVGWGRGQLTITAQPLRTEICAIFGSLEVNEV